VSLKLHNSLTKRTEEFVPREPGKVAMYVCGPNLYGPAHVGHGYSYAFFDVLRRYLEYRGYEVEQIQNFTDIEDRIIERAVREHRNILEIAQEYIDRFLREMDALGIRRADHYPRASETIPKIIEIIYGLVASGHAYQVNGDVYFRVTSFPRYLRLSGQSLEDMQAGARIEPDPRKEHPMDFSLWKAAKPGEPSWPSPWGSGRPGWHIECSAMSLQYLGEQIDIHGGGEDLVFPHHENEIAQSEAFTGRSPFVRYWLHNALMKLSEGDEMHRHLGNFVSLQEALARYEPDAIRIFFLGAHYRTPLRWTDDAVQASARGLERLRTAFANADQAIAASGDRKDGGQREAAQRARATFEQAMDDDLNTPQALAALFTLAAEINRTADAVRKGTSGAMGAPGLREARDVLRELLGVLGLVVVSPDQESLLATFALIPSGKDTLVPGAFREELTSRIQKLAEDLRRKESHFYPAEPPQHLEELVVYVLDGRERARATRNFKTADEIRNDLSKVGIIVEDNPGRPRWRIATPDRQAED